MDQILVSRKLPTERAREAKS